MATARLLAAEGAKVAIADVHDDMDVKAPTVPLRPADIYWSVSYRDTSAASWRRSIAEQSGPHEQFDRATADLILLLQGIEEIYWRWLAVAIPADTYAARFP